MTKAEVEIINPGAFTILTQNPDFKYSAFGVPSKGPCDLQSSTIGKWLVNDSQALQLECTGSGLKIKFDSESTIAISGANVGVILNDRVILRHYKTYQIQKNSIIKVSKPMYGYRTYITIAGRIIEPKENIITERLIKNQKIYYTSHQTEPRKADLFLYTAYSTRYRIRVTKGPEFHTFSDKIVNQLLTRIFAVSSKLNRMGVKLEEKLNFYEAGTQMISSGIVPGTVQISRDGTILIMLQDAQTTGGYPRIFNIISADMDKIGQAAPGNNIEFTIVDLDEAHSVLRLYKENLSLFQL